MSIDRRTFLSSVPLLALGPLTIQADPSVGSKAVQAEKRKGMFEFVHLTDTESFEYGDWVNHLKDFIRDEQPAFTVHTGDICYEKGMCWHSRHITTETMGGKFYYCLGNHDLVEGAYGEQLFEKLFGPVMYSFEVQGVLFVVAPMLSGDYQPSYTKKDVYRWLKKLLKRYPRDQPKIFFQHDLLTNGDTFAFGISEEERISLQEYNLKAWIYGHWHSNYVKTHGPDGVRSIGTGPPMGGIDHSPSVFRVIQVDGEGNVRTEVRYCYLNRHLVVAAPKAEQIPQLVDGRLPISVNVYHSAARTERVRFYIRRLDHPITWETPESEEGWQEMEARSDWNWTASWLPEQDAAGRVCELVVEAYLSNDRVIRTQETFTFAPAHGDVQHGDDWPNLLHNAAHTGDATRTVRPPLELVWTKNAGANIFMASPIVADGNVFTATIDDHNAENCFIAAYDAATGQERWRCRTDNSIKNTIVYAGGNVVATDVQGYTYAFDARSGALAWKKDLGYNRLPGFVSGLVSDGHSVYTGFGRALQRLRARDGAVRWKNEAWNDGEGSTPTMTLGDGVLVASAHWNALFGHDASTGELLWERDDHGLRFRDGSAALYEGKLYLAARRSLFVIDPRTGDILQRRETPCSHQAATTPLVTDDRIVVGTADRGLVAFDKSTLEPIWRFETGRALFYTVPYTASEEQSVETSPVRSGDTIYFGASDGWFYAVDLKTGDGVWKTELGAPVLTSVALSGEGVFIADYAGNLYAFRHRS